MGVVAPGEKQKKIAARGNRRMAVDTSITTNDTYEIEIKIAVQLIFTIHFLHKNPTIVLIYVRTIQIC